MITQQEFNIRAPSALSVLQEGLKQYCADQVQGKLRDPIFTSSVSRNPLEKDNLEYLIKILNNPNLKFYSKYAAVERYVAWTKYTFPDHELSKKFCTRLEVFLTNNAELNVYDIQQQTEITFVFHLNGTNNPSMCKRNVHVEIIEDYLTTHDGVYIEVPGVASDKNGLANPQNLLVDLIESSALTPPDDPLQLLAFKEELESSIKAGFSSRVPGWGRAKSKLTLKSWGESGEGVYSQVLFTAQKVIAIQQINPEAKIKLLGFGHSRGSVAVLLFNLLVQELITKETLSIKTGFEQECLTDPVPGGDNTEANYEQKFIDPLYDHFRNAHGKQPQSMLKTLQQLQPSCIKEVTISYAQNDTRFLYAEVYVNFHQSTKATYLAVPGPHSFQYGSLPLSIFNVGFREESRFIQNVGGTENQTNWVRDKVRQHYKEALEYLFTQVELKKSQLAFRLLDNYGKFLVEGYDELTLTQGYMVGHASSVRALDPRVLPTKGYEKLFYDRFHEKLFELQFPLLYNNLELVKDKGLENFKTAYTSLNFSGEFKQLPRSMQYLYLQYADKGGVVIEESGSEVTSKRRSRIDNSGIGYATAGVLGNSSRRRALALRETTEREALPLPTKQIYLKFIRELGADNKSPADKHHQKYAANYKYGEVDDVVFAIGTIGNRVVDLSRSSNQNEKITEYEKLCVTKEIQLISLLCLYSSKKNGKLPTPLYFFRHIAPQFLEVYLNSPVLQANWYSKSLNQIEPSITKQLAVLSYKDFLDGNNEIAIEEESGSSASNASVSRETFVKQFEYYCKVKRQVDTKLGVSYETFHDIDDRPQKVFEATAVVLQSMRK